MTHPSLTRDQIPAVVEATLRETRFIDIHTHLFMPSLGSLGLWGIDQLLTYHYLEAELFRFNPIQPAQYFALNKTAQADLIWKTLFVDNTPTSEATRGVIAVLQAFHLPTDATDLTEARRFFEAQKLDDHITNVFNLAGISHAVMTNDPLDPIEAPQWTDNLQRDERFPAVVRLDRILDGWSTHWPLLAQAGFAVKEQLDEMVLQEVRMFLRRTAKQMRAVYMAVSLADKFQFPADTTQARLLAEAVLPVCRDLNLPLSLMIGVRRQINPALRLAGDGVGRANLESLEAIARQFPDNRFLVSLLSRENQHEFCVIARKFANILPFGCWWFLNNGSIVEEITRQRLEMLGTSFIPQHSDARILEQVIYKWRNTRRTMTPILTNRYQLLLEDGGVVTESAIRRDVEKLFRGNFDRWIGHPE